MRSIVRISVSAAIVFAYGAYGQGAADSPPKITFEQGAGHMAILVDHAPFATYVWEDPAIPRPYFCDIKTPEGMRVTRPNPPDPVADKDNDDHATFHPGAWLAFGDLDGEDFWRNKARVRHMGFAKPPEDGPNGATFAVINAYETLDGNAPPVCLETCTYTVHALPEGCLLTARSEFRSESAPIRFGDQEEMGFGVRIDTPLTVRFGSGSIVNDQGGKSEEGTWGKQATWCAASGVVDGRRAGLVLFAAPDNFRPCWFHTRDYGLMVANPFGKKAMTAPNDKNVPADETVVKKGGRFMLGFGLFVFGGAPDREPDLVKIYDLYRATFANPSGGAKM